MSVKENIGTFKNSVRKSTFLKVIITLLSLIYPALWILPYYNIISIDFLNPMIHMWIGFYGCIILIYFVGINPINILLVLINVCIILFLMFISMMGGSGFPWALIIKMILPIIPFPWIISLFP